MKWGTMQEKLVEKGDIVETKRWGLAPVLYVEYENDLNWYTYTIETEYGQKRLQNDGFVFKGGKVVKRPVYLKNNTKSKLK